MVEAVTAFAPGRVNLIGEHTDYNGGLALPFAIDLGVTVSAAGTGGRRVHVLASDLGARDTFDLVAPPACAGWRAFARGAAAELRAAGAHLSGARLEVSGTVPRGGGLASSAALEAALCLALLEVSGQPAPDRMSLARICSRVENEWVGAPTGLLDQIASLCGERGRALLIDFASLEVTPVPLELEGFRLVTLDSGQRRANADLTGGYRTRRAECERACELLGVDTLRGATGAHAQRLPEPLRSRALHVIGENERVRLAVAALRAGDAVLLGELLDASHASLRDLFEVSTPAVEAAVERLRRAGAIGARLLGGGFGGHVLALLPAAAPVPDGALEVRPGPGAKVVAGPAPETRGAQAAAPIRARDGGGASRPGKIDRMTDSGLEAATQKMRAAGAHEEAISSFQSAYTRLKSGEAALLASAELEPAGEVPGLEELPGADPAQALSAVAMVKLNGGLATTMGLREPKSLIEARDGRSFLEIIIGQVLALRRRHGISLPLLLMDSDATRDATLRELARHPELAVDGLDPDFLQSMVPKLEEATLAPARWPEEPALEWCPPGHGDVYGALRRSGALDALLARGFRYAMISNADNLGARVDARIAAHLAAHEIPFLMEVVQGTEADRKGGHVARRRSDGRLVLRETAQTPPEDAESFRDHRRWRWYNTNTIWIDLRALSGALERTGGVLELPLIVNRKTVDPRDAGSTRVVQLESAMGAAIGSFEGARLLRVPRTRFAPVKTTDDLLVLRSDVYEMDADLDVTPVPERVDELPYVELDPRFYRLIDDFEARFPGGPPSLREARRLIVSGDVTFGAGIRVRGDARVRALQPTSLEPGTVLGSAA